MAASAAGASELMLEPCVNGEVSSSGNFPNETIERRVNAYVNWRSYDPYYLFAVSADYLESPFEQPEPEAEPR